MRQRAVGFVAIVVIMASSLAFAQGGVKVEKEDVLAKYLPATVFLDGENVPTQKRNAVLVVIGDKKTVFSLIDTSGYSSAYQQKYSGVILTQAAVKLGDKTLPAGAYGFGETKTGEHDQAAVTVHVYDVGGKEVAQMATERQGDMKGVRPLQVKTDAGSAQLYLGPYHVAVGAGE